MENLKEITFEESLEISGGVLPGPQGIWGFMDTGLEFIEGVVTFLDGFVEGAVTTFLTA